MGCNIRNIIQYRMRYNNIDVYSNMTVTKNVQSIILDICSIILIILYLYFLKIKMIHIYYYFSTLHVAAVGRK